MRQSITVVLVGSITLCGCSAMRMQMRYGTLDSQTEVSESLFLELRIDLPPTIYLAEASSADSQITVRPSLDRQLGALGYTIVDDPGEATYVMQVNHLS